MKEVKIGQIRKWKKEKYTDIRIDYIDEHFQIVNIINGRLYYKYLSEKSKNVGIVERSINFILSTSQPVYYQSKIINKLLVN